MPNASSRPHCVVSNNRTMEKDWKKSLFCVLLNEREGSEMFRRYI